MRNATPKEVGGILRRMVGANEAAERMNNAKFKEQRRRLAKEHDAFLSLVEEAILSGVDRSLKGIVENLNEFISRCKMVPLSNG